MPLRALAFFIWTAKSPIRLDGCPGRSDSSLDVIVAQYSSSFVTCMIDINLSDLIIRQTLFRLLRKSGDISSFKKATLNVNSRTERSEHFWSQTVDTLFEMHFLWINGIKT